LRAPIALQCQPHCNHKLLLNALTLLALIYRSL
jgi:hypothetical protein